MQIVCDRCICCTCRAVLLFTQQHDPQLVVMLYMLQGKWALLHLPGVDRAMQQTCITGGSGAVHLFANHQIAHPMVLMYLQLQVK